MLPERKASLIIWGCICYDGIETVTAVEDNINCAIKIQWHPRKYSVAINILVFLRQRIPVYGDNVPVHRDRVVENYKDEN